MTASITHPFHGVGLGLRWDFLEEVAQAPADVTLPFFEVAPENYMRRGGYYPHALSKVAQHTPILTHGLMLNIGSVDPLDQEYLRELKHFLGHFKLQVHTDHLCWNGNNRQILHDLLPLSLTKQTVARVANNVKRVQDVLGVPLGLENISYYTLPGGGTPLQEADFIAEVLEQADCLLLLDVNNILVNASNHTFDPLEYLKRLPLARVSHLHIAGGELRKDLDHLIIDTHGAPVNSACAQLMAHVVRQCGQLPVLYERDNEIPPLPQLLSEVAELQSVYDEALREHQGKRPAPAINLESSFSGYNEQLDAPVQTLFSRQILAAETCINSAGVLEFSSSPASDEVKATEGTQATDAIETLRRTPGTRLEVYRKLVRNGLVSTVRDFLERSVQQIGDIKFGHFVNEWLATVGPRSRFLRDIPLEFGAWLTQRIQSEEEFPAYLAELVDFELLEVRVASAQDSPLQNIDPNLDLEHPVLFAPSALRKSYKYRMTTWREAVAATPEAQLTHVLAYRDAAFEVRYLELTPLGNDLVQALQSGRVLGEAVKTCAASQRVVSDEGCVDDDFLARIAALLGDLADRGIVLGRPLASAQ